MNRALAFFLILLGGCHTAKVVVSESPAYLMVQPPHLTDRQKLVLDELAKPRVEQRPDLIPWMNATLTGKPYVAPVRPPDGYN